jgi:L-2,4-diaminobutyrate decarboxylase
MKPNPDDLKQLTDKVLVKLCAYISESQDAKGKALIQNSPESIAEQLDLEKWVKEGGLNAASVDDFIEKYLLNSQHIHHPHYIGHQVAVPQISSGIADFIHGVINNPMAIYEMGPSAAVIELFIINWMLEKVGWFKGSSLKNFSRIEGNGGGVLTHGGSLANLTALSAARSYIAPEAWTEGTPDDLVVLAPEEAHYSISRSISIMGMGQKSLIPVSVNQLKIMDPDALLPTLRKVRNNGKRVMAVVANACTTATGLYDPIDEIGQFCEEHNLWFHVDAAHGASAILSNSKKYLLKGIERADSLIWDAHKMMQTASLCTAVLFKDRLVMESTFRQKGSYLFYKNEKIGYDALPYTIECTKAAIGTKLFWALAAEGEKGVADYIDKTFDLAQKFYLLIDATSNFSCLCKPESNILCFEYTKFDSDNNFQLALRSELINRGNFYITSTEINNKRYLRLTVMNKLTNVEHIKLLLKEIVIIAKELNEKG